VNQERRERRRLDVRDALTYARWLVGLLGLEIWDLILISYMPVPLCGRPFVQVASDRGCQSCAFLSCGLKFGTALTNMPAPPHARALHRR
jgi:hypothetical protein